MKKLTAILCVVAVFCTMALTACTVERTIASDPIATTTTQAPVASIDDLSDEDFVCVEIDATQLKDEQTTTQAPTEVTQPEPEAPTVTEASKAPETTKKPTTKKPVTEAIVTEATTTTKQMAIPTIAQTTTKRTTTTTKKTTTTTKGSSVTTGQTTTTTQKSTTTTKKATNPTYNYTTGQKHTALPYTQRYHYNLLDDTQKRVYELVAEAVSNLDTQTEAFVVDDAHEKSYKEAYLAFHSDHPECFYLARYYGVTNYGGNKHRFSFLYSVASYDEDPTGNNQLFEDELSASLKSRILAKKATFDKEVNRIIATIPANAPDVVKEKMAYQTILKTSHYNLTAVTEYLWDGRCEDNWTAYGIMVNKKGVCESYAEAFQTLLLQMGINCMTISGSTSGGGHMWNAVELDDGWYMCDITFDDPVGAGTGTARYNYFNRTSQWMQDNSNHNWFMSDFKVPKCTKTKYSYVEYFGGSTYDEAWTD